MPDTLHVSLVYAEPGRQIVRELDVATGATVADAIRLSAIASAAGLPAIDFSSVGIYGKTVAPDAVLRDGDHIEILRPLKVDPKEARRRRAVSRK